MGSMVAADMAVVAAMPVEARAAVDFPAAAAFVEAA
jgi:hypothetical protein